MTVSFTPSFVRAYKKLPAGLREEVEDKIKLFTDNPHHPFLRTHRLKGKLKGRYSFSVNYEYRIVFRFLSKEEVVLLAVGDHDVYR